MQQQQPPHHICNVLYIVCCAYPPTATEGVLEFTIHIRPLHQRPQAAASLTSAESRNVTPRFTLPFSLWPSSYSPITLPSASWQRGMHCNIAAEPPAILLPERVGAETMPAQVSQSAAADRTLSRRMALGVPYVAHAEERWDEHGGEGGAGGPAPGKGREGEGTCESREPEAVDGAIVPVEESRKGEEDRRIRPQMREDVFFSSMASSSPGLP